jgi:hypothetical protein
MLTINVYKVADPAMTDFVAAPPCSHYFHEVALHLADRVAQFDRHLDALQCGACRSCPSDCYIMPALLLHWTTLNFCIAAVEATVQLCHSLEKYVKCSAGHASAVPEMNGVMTEMEDYLSYVGDILDVAPAKLRAEVSRKFWDGFAEPAIIAPLLHAQVCFFPDASSIALYCARPARLHTWRKHVSVHTVL